MTDLLDRQEGPAPALAGWPVRALGAAIDVLPGFAVAAAAGIAAFTAPPSSPWWWAWSLLCGAAILLTAANRVLLPAVTGWSLGRAVVGVRVARADGRPIGPGRLLAREAAHLLDTAPLLAGWLLPLWERRGRTGADLLAGTEAHRVPPPSAPVTGRLAALLTAAALLCAGVTAASYLLVYQPDRTADNARADIARVGPKLVVEMLSYAPDTIDADFERAATVTTERYRPELEVGQRAAREAPLRHNYFVPHSAVLESGADHARVLVLLRGELGDPPEVWNSTVTAVVGFVKQDRRWLIDEMTILPRSQHEEGGP
ncbi:RDD family protein [Mycobacterium sp. 1274756.6]|uniref:RDD family protein n=1 Tax=Mycobacterium sp. 1274756.6 TaxID=1834076 RepID=UPI0007FF90D8|nr:RDD family protein [Mycobacterium sp. 1274756.6]OBJ67443.1 hypothetical protein A5643_16955 [Mycobacterium sp. 1274756.6]